MTARGFSLLAGLLLSLSGCATVKLTPADEAKLAELQAFADRVTAAYRAKPATIFASEFLWSGEGAAAETKEGELWRRGNRITVRARHLRDPFVRELVAHELAHHVLGHVRPRFDKPTPAQRIRWELDANAEAVRILQVAAGMTHSEAFGRVFLWLYGVARRDQAGHLERAEGHVDPCAEIQHLVRTFPQYAAGVARANRRLSEVEGMPAACTGRP